MTLQVRKPEIDQTGAPIVWSRTPEFALFWNGASAVIPYVEHFLNDVMNEVRADRCAGNPGLKQELEGFLRQEAMHARAHVAFNKRLYEAGFAELKPLIGRIVAELKTMREKRSLAFCAAYCAGFENTATFSAKFLFEKCDDLFEGADPRAANLFLWHVAEEFEHRAVCHEAFRAVSGNYFMRLWGLAYSFWHINRSFNLAAGVIFDRYRAPMTPAERAASKRRQARLVRRQLIYTLPRLLFLVNPGFDPARIKVPARIRRALEFFAASGPIDRSVTEQFGLVP